MPFVALRFAQRSSKASLKRPEAELSRFEKICSLIFTSVFKFSRCHWTCCSSEVEAYSVLKDIRYVNLSDILAGQLRDQRLVSSRAQEARSNLQGGSLETSL